jgi:DNA-binding transcriptional LysR family regulator
MDLKQLRYFQAVALHRSFSKAAEHLHIAQPAISMSIKKLEEHLNLTLFHRADRTIRLTDEGERLLIHANTILQSFADAELEMRELHGLERGTVRIGISSMLGSYYFPPILMAFKKRYPKLNLEVIEGGTWQLQQMIESGELDMGVVVDAFISPHLQRSIFLREPMLVTLNHQHPLAKKSAITYEEFFKEELVMFKAGYFHRNVIDRLASQIGATPNIGFETNLVPLIKAIIKQGYGVSTLLGMAVADDSELVALPFAEPIFLDLAIAWPKERYLSKANQVFVDFLMEYCSSQNAEQSL